MGFFLMTDMKLSPAQAQQHVELRVGVPYANLIAHQQLFVEALGRHFQIDPAYILPTAGTTGAIEAVRNHVLKISKSREPVVYMLFPEYWRAKESFLGLGLRLREASIERENFLIDEQNIVEEVLDIAPDLLYFSLPNNPTGATFLPEKIIAHIPEHTAMMIDLTLPSADFDLRAIVPMLHHRFAEKSSLFLVGSFSKSHRMAEHRIGWLIGSSLQQMKMLREENRNVVSTFAIQQGLQCLDQQSPAVESIKHSFACLKEGEKQARYEIVRPPRMVESGYVLLKALVDIDKLQLILQQENIHVMWGTELGLPNAYIRLEAIETANIKIFVDIVNKSFGGGEPH